MMGTKGQSKYTLVVLVGNLDTTSVHAPLEPHCLKSLTIDAKFKLQRNVRLLGTERPSQK